MPELPIDRKERLVLFGHRMDHVLCVAIFIAASMPAIVVMLILAFPLLPLFGVWVSLLAAAEGLTKIPSGAELRTEEIEHKDDSGHTGATPHYA